MHTCLSWLSGPPEDDDDEDDNDDDDEDDKVPVQANKWTLYMQAPSRTFGYSKTITDVDFVEFRQFYSWKILQNNNIYSILEFWW